MRAAAWTLALKCYQQIDRGIGFIRYEEDDEDQIVPSLFDHSRTRKKREKPGTDPNAPAAPSPAPVPVNGNNATTPNSPSSPITPSKPFE